MSTKVCGAVSFSLAAQIFWLLAEAALSYIAEKLGEKEAKIYNTRLPNFGWSRLGHLIMLSGAACHVNGADRIQMAIEEELKIRMVRQRKTASFL